MEKEKEVIVQIPELADQQIAWAPQAGSQVSLLCCPIFEALIHGGRGTGKAVSLDHPVLTDSGWKPAGNVVLKDRLVAIDGSYTEIEGIFPQGDRPLYTITFEDGATSTADVDHLWEVYDSKNQKWHVKKTLELKQRIEDGRNIKNATSWQIPLLENPVPGKKWDGLDPYVIGLMLGDGTTGSDYATVYSVDPYIIDYLVNNHGWRAYDYRPRNNAVMVSSLGPKSELWKDATGRAKAAQKRVGPELLSADPETRLSVLQGLMDSDGSVDKEGRCSFASVSRGLCEDVQYLVRSLGGRAKIGSSFTPKSDKGPRLPFQKMTISHANKFNPFRLPRKAERVRTQTGVRRAIISIEQAGNGAAVCFAVKHPRHLFVIKDFVVTHNTDTLIMDFCRDVGKGYGADWRGVLFRRTYPELADVIEKTKKWIPAIWPQAKYNETKSMWKWPTGESLLLRPYEKESSYYSYHGHAYPWIAYEELTTWPTEACYTKMFSTCRSSNPKVAKIARIRATTNPSGIGFNWVKRRFKLPEHTNKIIRGGRDVNGNPEPDRVAIKGTIYENKALIEADPNYIARIEASASTEAERRAWLYGDWTIVSGGMFDDLWDPDVHVVKPFRIPHEWRIIRGFDWGSSRPFSVGWYAISDGSDVQMNDGRWRSTVRGDHFRLDEYYGTSGRPNEGVKMMAVDIARNIVEKELKLGIYHRCQPGHADHAIFKTENGNCIATDMAKDVRLDDGREYRGVTFLPADKSAGSRVLGWETVRKMLHAAKPLKTGPREKPGVFIFSTCEHLINLLPAAPRDPRKLDDIDTDYEDHNLDELRYILRGVGTNASYGQTEGLQ